MNQEILQKLKGMEACRAFAYVRELVDVEVSGIREKIAGKKKLGVEEMDEKLDLLEVMLDAVKGNFAVKMREMFLWKLKQRFFTHESRHMWIKWEQIESKVKEWEVEKVLSLKWMEDTGGEPDVVVLDGKLAFVDMSEESPRGRRNCVYDAAGEKVLQEKHLNAKCDGNAVEMAKNHGVEILNEAQYRAIQDLEQLDENSWSWILTNQNIRKLGYALLGDRDAKVVSVDLNDASGHGIARAFRALLWI